MRNRAKCRLCGDIIESFHSTDFVSCKCDEISVYAGAAMRCGAKNFANFMRIDDLGNEIVVTLKEVDSSPKAIKPLTKDELLSMLHELIKSIDNLPTHAMTAPVTHYDLSAALSLVLAIFRAEDAS